MINIMIIDDQPLLAEWLRNELLDGKYQILSTTDPYDIREDMRSFNPDIILFDIHLDGFERWDILHRLKLEFPKIPVLIISAYNNLGNDPRLSEANGYFIKDINTDKIENKVLELLNHD